MVCTDKAMICVFQVGFKSNYCFLSHILYLFHEVAHVLTFTHKVFDYGSEQLFGALIIILELLTWCLESLGVFIQTEVCKMHVMILDIVSVRFLVIMSTKTSQTLIT